MATLRYGLKASSALDLWVKLARASAMFSHRTHEHIRTFGLTESQFSALETLGHKGPLTVGELCKKQLVSGGNMTVVIDNLEREQLVERVRSSTDRRVILVHLTAKGKALFESIFPKHAEYVAGLASVLGEDEQRDLSRLLKKLGVALQQHEAVS
jgi:MarR family transcriptional regulator, 2-MHQ and catechol-resistance regulon repressor